MQSRQYQEWLRASILLPMHGPHRLKDASPQLVLKWNKAVTIQTIQLTFDTDFDHPMESVLMQHPEHAMPFVHQELLHL
jgi:hypothetical protein